MDPGAHADYGLWSIAAINSALFIVFAFSFWRPRTSTDWRAFGGFSAFLVALFTEMYGFPLTIYLFSGWLQRRYPEVDFLAHDSGHLLEVAFGWRANPHLGPFHVASSVLLIAGFWLLVRAWRALYAAQREGRVATSGPYARVRHPQYTAFVVILFSFLLQWPTILTVVMFPILVFMYARLARREERDSLERFGDAYLAYAERTPAFVPRLRARVAAGGGG